LEAFSDGVIAVIITIMVLELRAPEGANLAALAHVLPMFFIYVLSFVAIGIFWNNHHHLLRMAKQVNTGVMWANLHFLFWLSLIPFVTSWLGEHHTETVPTMLYGLLLLLASFAYQILELALVKSLGEGSALQQALGSDRKGKMSVAMYVIGIAAAFWAWWLADALYALVAIMWFIPDRRVESKLRDAS
jgi:uncharacterized membrane protein